ncbi:MAG: hypothetical protein RLZ12_284 [Bacillota bacterium]|jgi:hypothetical protein
MSHLYLNALQQPNISVQTLFDHLLTGPAGQIVQSLLDEINEIYGITNIVPFIKIVPPSNVLVQTRTRCDGPGNRFIYLPANEPIFEKLVLKFVYELTNFKNCNKYEAGAQVTDPFLYVLLRAVNEAEATLSSKNSIFIKLNRLTATRRNIK